jgi:predicted secreted Zn-dependent protease
MALRSNPTSWSYYQIAASSLADVVEILSPRDEWGHCSPEFNYEFASSRNGKPVGLRVTLDVSIELPRWVGYESAPAGERKEWTRVYGALKTHEQGHEKIARRGALVMHKKLLAAPTYKLERLFGRERERVQATSDAYDHATDHGRRQGTMVTIP